MPDLGGPSALSATNMDDESSSPSTAQVISAPSENPLYASTQPTTSLLSPQLTVYSDDHIVAGLSQCPTTAGQTLVILKNLHADLFSLQVNDFTKIMIQISNIAKYLRFFYHVRRCALVTEGGTSLSIIPLHGLNKVWQPILSRFKELHEGFPGYISSIDGPRMSDTRLDTTCAQIRMVSGISSPLKHSFHGDQSDDNLFAKIVRGELPQWRVCEDDGHVAFLSPFANTPGFTVIVPRAHLSSDIFSLDEEAYAKLVAAAYGVARILKEAFSANCCGMIFEGFEIDYAHVKLIPKHRTVENAPSSRASYEENYQGYVTSLQGPSFKDIESLADNAVSFAKLLCQEPCETI